MLRTTAPVPDSAVAANPALRGRTPLQVFDAVVAALTDGGFAVILNNHTVTTRWCCAVDGNERWNSSGQSTAGWADDWVFMAKRYRANPRVVGADLYNEVRRDIWDDPNWAWATTTTGTRRRRKPATASWPRPTRTCSSWSRASTGRAFPWTASRTAAPPSPRSVPSHTLVVSNKLVYSAHFYGYTGPNHSGATGVGETSDLRYQDFTREQLRQVVHDQALYVSAETGRHFTAPVWVSEFGIGADERVDKPVTGSAT